MKRMYTNCSASLQRFFCDNTGGISPTNLILLRFHGRVPLARRQKLRFFEQNVRHTLVCRDLTKEVSHWDERQTKVCRTFWPQYASGVAQMLYNDILFPQTKNYSQS